jgi:hypothetical protein
MGCQCTPTRSSVHLRTRKRRRLRWRKRSPELQSQRPPTATEYCPTGGGTASGSCSVRRRPERTLYIGTTIGTSRRRCARCGHAGALLRQVWACSGTLPRLEFEPILRPDYVCAAGAHGLDAKFVVQELARQEAARRRANLEVKRKQGREEARAQASVRTRASNTAQSEAKARARAIADGPKIRAEVEARRRAREETEHRAAVEEARRRPFTRQDGARLHEELMRRSRQERQDAVFGQGIHGKE